MIYEINGDFKNNLKIEKFTDIQDIDEFGPNEGISEDKKYGYIHAYRVGTRGRADTNMFIKEIQNFYNSSSSGRFVFRGYFRPKITGNYTFSHYANSGTGAFIFNEHAPNSGNTGANNTSRTGALLYPKPKKWVSGSIELEAEKIYPFRLVLGGAGYGTLNWTDPEGVKHTSFEGYLHHTPMNDVKYIPVSEQVKEDNDNEFKEQEKEIDDALVQEASEAGIEINEESADDDVVEEEETTNNTLIYIGVGVLLLIILLIIILKLV